eukprot:4653927-Pleurochrysis_carterae.AAC.3
MVVVELVAATAAAAVVEKEKEEEVRVKVVMELVGSERLHVHRGGRGASKRQLPMCARSRRRISLSCKVASGPQSHGGSQVSAPAAYERGRSKHAQSE